MGIVLLAAFGAALICYGSFFLIVVPGDETGMVAFPPWVIGTVLGIWAILLASRTPPSPRKTWIGIILFAAISLGSVVWSIVAGARYSADAPRTGALPSHARRGMG